MPRNLSTVKASVFWFPGAVPENPSDASLRSSRIQSTPQESTSCPLPLFLLAEILLLYLPLFIYTVPLVLPILPAPSSAGGSVSSVPLHLFAPPSGPLNHLLGVLLPFAISPPFRSISPSAKARRWPTQPQPPCLFSLGSDRRPVLMQTRFVTNVWAQHKGTVCFASPFRF